MALVVQHNLTAMNANRQLGVTTNAQAKSTEKLSSGYRINRAGDDAAGLTISEKMRSQIRGLDQASTNAQDGVSLIQTAEGALNEAHSILQRMNELAVKGANDTNQSIDRTAIQKELNALVSELDRISSTTQFNKQNLIDGTYLEKKLQIGANSNQFIDVNIRAMDSKSLGFGVSQAGVKYVASNIVLLKSAGGITGSFRGATATRAAALATSAMNSKGATFAGKTFDIISSRVVASKAATRLISVDDYQTSNNTIDYVQNAINIVSDQRSALGAIQNRLEHTIANLDVASENAQAAESRIRDVDMAKEMVEYSKNNILAQAGQSMLAQANQSTQGVLSLLG